MEESNSQGRLSMTEGNIEGGGTAPDPTPCKDTLHPEAKVRLMKILNERQGTARVKADFIDFEKIHLKYGFGSSESHQPPPNSEGDSSKTPGQTADARGPPKKKFKKERGMNHNRPRNRWVPVSEKLCPSIISGEVCSYGERCNYSHDIAAKAAARELDIGDRCYNFETFGKCRYGVVCRFGSSHLTEDFRNITDEEKFEANASKSATLNNLAIDLKVKLRKKKVKFEKAEQFLSLLAKSKKKSLRQFDQNEIRNGAPEETRCLSSTPGTAPSNLPTPVDEVGQNSVAVDQESTANQNQVLESGSVQRDAATNLGPDDAAPTLAACQATSNQSGDCVPLASQQPRSGIVTNQDIIRTRKCEKKQVNFEGKSYLAPLTTVGNLPFRRVCKRLGADITCGEMAMATNLLQGQPSEWALLKRHSSEDCFGVQLAGYFPDTISKCAELINTYCEVDFVDLNVGCPIDLVFQKGGGSALMGRANKFEDIVRGLDAVLDVPVTVKMRTGISEKHNTAHKLIPKIYDWGASLVTLHGRSREQRYTRTADWNYIRQCVEVAKPHPLIGNGDILSYEDVKTHLENSGAAGVMIARGALIKPWIFTEIKEQRHWDISANERLDILREYTNYGLEHWGSDTEGVEKTRRFLLEWLSFLHRYIPVGILERLPQKIQERPPYYVGRSDLETLFSSTNCADWVKISEMLLGPVPDGFQFLPKHKANSYS
ncbi:tRNA-dihydrouridine(47) synthase [NAD(P)(+)]-like [Acanthaster planci]|uniref:tRNA-dihydrouridine(47) synthase [NAD(P)(+)] n=1 Tax=Acanthaster planci TaxID=133434 RepID=A0A8B7YU91_ACAPL|nr:tRNA-dihydrouridine(47) synthase [NAD(P)(+)]-like [Acanthaster planci]XP_022096869.1 tRNA-dihydrouridine(47) synthase [NAD(P)(+)]-like [Acanthaster planci]XP_022096870.1 tRNA-dihydrouridine(47) synthase [NAD(P)(+)]-like [Acanthaster planci]XP_022096871.1 tRNA-dihydrouridine(47) synthase [NAD(P)(+)]-like [Acanthaster planci]